MAGWDRVTIYLQTAARQPLARLLDAKFLHRSRRRRRPRHVHVE